MKANRIIVTGLIASGKSKATEILKNKGYEVISADEINRKLLEKGNINYDVLRNDSIFSKYFVGENLDKKMLSQELFKDIEKIKRINNLTHQNIYNTIEENLSRVDKKAVFIEIPLFLQTDCPLDYDSVWLIDAPESIKAERLVKRDNISLKDALNRIRVQQKAVKEKHIDEILDNSKDDRHLELQIDRILNRMEKQ